jgi:hypothetical protein
MENDMTIEEFAANRGQSTRCINRWIKKLLKQYDDAGEQNPVVEAIRLKAANEDPNNPARYTYRDSAFIISAGMGLGNKKLVRLKATVLNSIDRFILNLKGRHCEWRSCKIINPKYLEHITCPMMNVSPLHFKGTCQDCICTKVEFMKLDMQSTVTMSVAITISVISIGITVLGMLIRYGIIG